MWWHLILFILLLASLFLSVELYAMNQKIAVGRAVSGQAVAYSSRGDGVPALLVLGDSTAVGVGAATPRESVPGLLAARLRILYVENHAVSGAQVRDLPEQIAKAERRHYDVILVMIGGNDIIRFHPAGPISALLGDILKTFPSSEKTVLVSAANVGASTLFPRIVRPLHTWLNQEYHKAFTRVATGAGITYVNLFVPATDDPFVRDPARYLAPDGLHPSSAGYQVWADAIAPALGI